MYPLNVASLKENRFNWKNLLGYYCLFFVKKILGVCDGNHEWGVRYLILLKRCLTECEL